MYMEVECTFVYIGSRLPQLASEKTISETGEGKFYDSDVISGTPQGGGDATEGNLNEQG